MIGRGGTSLVYLARDRNTDRPVAVPIIDSGDVNTLLYLVRPFIDGESLRDVAITGESVSVEGLFIGTPLYRAPEQLFSDQPVDERLDVYGLATVLYETSEGRTPFDGQTNMAITLAFCFGILYRDAWLRRRAMNPTNPRPLASSTSVAGSGVTTGTNPLMSAEYDCSTPGRSA